MYADGIALRNSTPPNLSKRKINIIAALSCVNFVDESDVSPFGKYSEELVICRGVNVVYAVLRTIYN